MTTYSSTPVTNNQQAPSHGLYGDLKSYTASVTTTAAVTTADTLNLCYLPKNAVIWGFECKATQMDTNGSPTLAWNVGDSGSATRFFAATTVGRTATPQWKNETDATATHSGVGFQTTGLTLVTAVPSANPATGAAGTFSFNVYYTLVGGAS
jgi:hypothetical protein